MREKQRRELAQTGEKGSITITYEMDSRIGSSTGNKNIKDWVALTMGTYFLTVPEV